MHGPTLIVTLVLVLVLTTGILALLHRLHPEIPGPGAWATGSGLIAAGLTLALQRGGPLQSVTLVGGNAAVLVGYGTILIGLRRFYGLPAHAALILPVALLLALPIATRTDIDAGADIRIVFASFGGGVLMAACAAVPARACRGTAGCLALALFAAHCIFLLLRAAWTLAHPSGVDYLYAGTATAVTLLEGLSFGVTITAAFTLMVSERLRGDLARLASRDALTDLLNRRGFEMVCEKLFGERAAAGRVFAVLMMDLDHFKQVNDTRGHEAGDRVLSHFSRIVEAHLRSEDVFARLGGEEFVALLPDCSLPRAMEAAERLRAALALAPSDPPVTVSIGIAGDRAANATLTDLHRRADAALYRAKAEGRDRVVVEDRRAESEKAPAETG